MKRVYTSPNKSKVLARAKRARQEKIWLWKDPAGHWHAVHGVGHVPDWAVEVEHIR